MEELAAKPLEEGFLGEMANALGVPSLNLDPAMWQSITMWLLAVYGFLQFISMLLQHSYDLSKAEQVQGDLFKSHQAALDQAAQSFIAGNSEFRTTYLAPQNERSSWQPPVLLTRRAETLKVPPTKKPKGKIKRPFLNPDFRDLIEMGFWLQRFVSQYEKMRADSIVGQHRVKSSPVRLFSKGALNVMSLMMFMVNYMHGFEQIFKRTL